jgi:hypothetical protein
MAVKRFLLAAALTLSLASFAAAARAEGTNPGGSGEPQGKIVATTEAPQIYVVRPGDTLWGVSQRLFDTPWVWPKLWEQNSSLANPHLLYPGLKLVLYTTVQTNQQAYQDQAAPAAPPAPAAPARPAAPPAPLFCPLAHDVGYVSHEAPELAGKIVAAQDPLKLYVGTGEKVYIETAQGLRVGDRFRVVHVSRDEVEHPVTHESLGHAYTFPGVLQVVEVKERAATARIVESFQDIQVGDALTPWFPMPAALTLKRGGPASFQGRLVAGQEGQVQIGQGALVYLDLGGAAGLQPGQVLEVWGTRELPGGVPVNELEAGRLGEAVVLVVHPETSTALVTRAQMEMHSGDLVRGR